MTARELLELAAKAAGLDIDWDDWIDYGSHNRFRLCGTTRYWNAKHDDGDALRLATGLRIDVEWETEWLVVAGACSEDIKDHGNDHCAATRSAIVRAAAEIGAQQP